MDYLKARMKGGTMNKANEAEEPDLSTEDSEADDRCAQSALKSLLLSTLWDGTDVRAGHPTACSYAFSQTRFCTVYMR